MINQCKSKIIQTSEWPFCTFPSRNWKNESNCQTMKVAEMLVQGIPFILKETGG